MPGMSTPVLELKGLSKSFGGLDAVRGVSLQIMAGDRKAIIGPNGAGKTTLFNVITGVLPASAGQVLLFGRDITGWASYRRTALGMARTFQITSLFPGLTVLDNVLLAVAGVRGIKFVMWRSMSSYHDLHARARELLEGAGYWDRRDILVSNLSHGEQRQIEIVLGLASAPAQKYHPRNCRYNRHQNLPLFLPLRFRSAEIRDHKNSRSIHCNPPVVRSACIIFQDKPLCV